MAHVRYQCGSAPSEALYAALKVVGPIAIAAGREPLWHLDVLQAAHHDAEAGVALGHQWAGEHLKLFIAGGEVV